MDFMKKGQSAFEYIMVVGVALMILVPGAMLMNRYSYKSGDEVIRSQIEMVGNGIVDSVEKVYYIGENSWETLKYSIPNNVREMYVLDNYELVIVYGTHTGTSEAVFFSDINMTTSYYDNGRGYFTNETHTGLNIIKISSMGKYVFINETR